MLSHDVIKSDKFDKFLRKIKKIIENIVECKKEGDLKAVVQWHEKLDTALHAFVGQKGKTPEEKEKRV